jgi:hypothetical protein
MAVKHGSLKESIVQRLSVFERKILSKILGPTKRIMVFGELNEQGVG